MYILLNIDWKNDFGYMNLHLIIVTSISWDGDGGIRALNIE